MASTADDALNSRRRGSSGSTVRFEAIDEVEESNNGDAGNGDAEPELERLRTASIESHESTHSFKPVHIKRQPSGLDYQNSMSANSIRTDSSRSSNYSPKTEGSQNIGLALNPLLRRTSTNMSRLASIRLPKMELAEDQRQVHVAANINSVSEVNESEQAFVVVLFLQFWWFAMCDNDSWKPWLDWLNAVETNKLESTGFIELQHEATANAWTVQAGEEVKASFLVQAKFKQEFDLRLFPSDAHTLVIQLMIGPENIVLQPHPGRALCKMDPRKFLLPQWRLMDEASGVRAHLTSSSSKESASGTRYPILEMQVPIQRLPERLLFTIVFPAFVFTSCSFTLFTVTARDQATRFTIVLTLMLTLVALNFTVNDKLPAIPYMTLFDKYYLACFYCCALLLMWTSVVSGLVRANQCGDPESNLEEAWDTCQVLDIGSAAVLSTVWLSTNVYFWRKMDKSNVDIMIPYQGARRVSKSSSNGSDTAKWAGTVMNGVA